MKWARPYINVNSLGDEPKGAGAVLKAGDVIRLQRAGDGWSLAQIPDVEGALVSLDPDDGSILALTGGFDFYRSKFNRATQAERQPGSSFKPFIYSAALEHGYTPASIINDAPVVYEDESLTGAWRPENYSGKFFRSHPSAHGALQVAQPRLHPAAARHRHRLRARPHREVRNRRRKPAPGPVACARQRGADAAGRSPPGTACWPTAGMPSSRTSSSACWTGTMPSSSRPTRSSCAVTAPDDEAIAVSAATATAGDGDAARHRRPRPAPAPAPSGLFGAPRAARHRRPQRMADVLPDARRHPPRHRTQGAGAGARRSRRQDGHHERTVRCVVFRVRPGSRRHRLDRVRRVPPPRAAPRRALVPRCRCGSPT